MYIAVCLIVWFMQSESTLWKLKFFVKSAMQFPRKSSASMGGNNQQNNSNKRKICDALAMSTQKRSKKWTLGLW